MTALDLLITLTIVTLLVSAGVPAVRSWGQEQRMRAAVTALQSDLQFARAEAIRLDSIVLTCPGTVEDGCLTDRGWDRGWIVFADLDGDRMRQAGEPLLKEAMALEGLAATSPANRRRLRFFPNGSAPGSNTTVTFCDSRGAPSARQIRISNSGRIRRLDPGLSPRLSC